MYLENLISVRGGCRVARCLQNYNIRSQEPVTYQNKVDREGKQAIFRKLLFVLQNE